jgi:hypothetical protein
MPKPIETSVRMTHRALNDSNVVTKGRESHNWVMVVDEDSRCCCSDGISEGCDALQEADARRILSQFLGRLKGCVAPFNGQGN